MREPQTILGDEDALKHLFRFTFPFRLWLDQYKDELVMEQHPRWNPVVAFLEHNGWSVEAATPDTIWIGDSEFKTPLIPKYILLFSDDETTFKDLRDVCDQIDTAIRQKMPRHPR